jgi:hypothetical protein
MAVYPFLSDEWMAHLHKIGEEMNGSLLQVSAEIAMNLVVTEVPFGSGTVDAHLDTTDGRLQLGTGHLEVAEITATLDYETAKAVLVEGNSQAAVQALLSGRIHVVGDITRLLALQGGTPDPEAQQFAKRIRAVTA